jgi:hypothetical protein
METQMSEFDKLAQDLELLAKSQIADKETDEKIAAAAEEGDAVDGDDEGDEDEVLGKSFSMERDGEQVQAYDATTLLKSMIGRIDTIESTDAENRQHLGKSLELISDMLKAQTSEIASLKKSLGEIGGEGRGRKTVLTISEKASSLTKSESGQPSNGELMAKCLTAQKAGRLTALDVSRANVAVESGLAVPGDILARLPE